MNMRADMRAEVQEQVQEQEQKQVGEICPFMYAFHLQGMCMAWRGAADIEVLSLRCCLPLVLATYLPTTPEHFSLLTRSSHVVSCVFRGWRCGWMSVFVWHACKIARRDGHLHLACSQDSKTEAQSTHWHQCIELTRPNSRRHPW